MADLFLLYSMCQRMWLRCDGHGEVLDKQVWRILSVDSNDGRVVEAENARQKFVKESEIKFADEDFWGEEKEEEDESKTNSESSTIYSDY